MLNEHTHLGMVLGKLLHGQDTLLEHQSEIRDRLQTVESDVRSLQETDRSSGLERSLKVLLQWAIPVGVAWATGGVEKALQVLQAFKVP